MSTSEPAVEVQLKGQRWWNKLERWKNDDDEQNSTGEKQNQKLTVYLVLPLARAHAVHVDVEDVDTLE